jgi:hypothetical protein
MRVKVSRKGREENIAKEIAKFLSVEFSFARSA